MHTTHKPLPAGLDQQGRYITRPYRAITDDELLTRATDSLVAKYSTGQPIAGEAVPSDEWHAVPDDEARGLWAVLFAPAAIAGLVALAVVFWSEIQAVVEMVLP
jgi:hypothetical protein